MAAIAKKLFVFIQVNIVLIAIFLLALTLRTYQLSEFPVGLHGDEASVGYNAYSILKTGHDQNGQISLSIDQFGDFRPAGIHYLDVPFVAIFGLNETAVRLPAAIFGSLNILLIYFLTNILFKRKRLALMAAGLLAILPWDINLSRATSESVIAAFFATLGIILLLLAFERKRKVILLFSLSAISLIVSFLFYHAARYFTILLLPFLLFYAYLAGKKKLIFSLIVLAVVGVSLIFILIAGNGGGRVSEVSLLSIPGGTVNLKHAMDEEGTANPLITRFYDNKLIYYGRFFITFYSEHLSGDFLFVNNGNPIRYKIPYTGNLYLIQAPFLLLGLAFLLYEGLKSKKYYYLIPIIWLLLAPVPAGLTWEDLPNVERSMFEIVPLVIISVFGFEQTVLLLKGKVKAIFITIVILLLAYGFVYFLHNYFWRLKIEEPWYRGYATKELIFKIQLLTKADPKAQFVMTTQANDNFIFYLFFTKFDPKTYQQLGSPREHDGLHFQNLIYLNQDCPLIGQSNLNASVAPHTFYVDKPECQLPKNAEVIDTINTSDGIPALEIVQLNNPASDNNQTK